ncbi:MAG: hypothetical protein MJ208_03870 [Bacilli bacterium]|nr:hypothetical protein [Bacilli bacterium]
MKKLNLLIMPLMAISFLASCGGGDNPGPEPEESNPLAFTCLSEKATLTLIPLSKFNQNDPIPSLANLEYSYDKKDWIAIPTEITETTLPIFTLNKDETIYFRGDNPSEICGSVNFMSLFTGVGYDTEHDGDLEVKGNVMSIVKKENFDQLTEIIRPGSFYSLFMNNRNIVDASQLILPNNISKSSTCYRGMFSNCDYLKKAPKLNATTLSEECYKNMFYKCTQLEEAPFLPATELKEQCYMSMFSGCESLNHVKVGFGTPGSSDWPPIGDSEEAEDATNSWLTGVSSKGTFEWVGNDGTDATWTRDVDHVPDGWNIQTIQPNNN